MAWLKCAVAGGLEITFVQHWLEELGLPARTPP
jgi:hypothetical protein